MSSDPVVDSDIERPPCPLCGSFNSSAMHVFGRLSVVRCRECGLFYLSPRLKESLLMSMYQSDGYFLQRDNTGYDDYAFQEESLRTTFRRFLERLKERNMTSGTLLEIGSGYGYFLCEAKRFFAEVSGIELSEKAASHGRTLSGAEIHAGDLDTLPLEAANFDILVAINVIEHIYNPLEFIRAAGKRLRNGGRIVLATPDIGSFWYRIMKDRWPSFKVPEHVAFYTSETLAFLLQRAGFNDISHIPFPHAFPFGLIAAKFGISLSGKVAKKPLWLPRTMVALTARKDRFRDEE